MSTLKVNTIRHTGASSDAVTLASDGTCTAKITNRSSNLIINGSMICSQRGTSGSGNSGYHSVDRWYNFNHGVDENPTIAQADLTSSDTPFSSGFRNSLKVTNGNQTSGADAADQTFISTKLEAKEIANSGWNYTSTSSYITLSFWVKASVAQTYYGFVKAPDGSNYIYPYSIALSANTWTKVTKTIPGNSNLQFDNNHEEGLEVGIYLFLGTNFTNSGVSLDTWAAYNGSTRTPDHTSTWYTTNDATFEITGVQLEVGEVATDFEHRSYGDELLRCQRYYYAIKGDTNDQPGISGSAWGSNYVVFPIRHPVEMRANPSFSGTGNCRFQSQNDSAAIAITDMGVNNAPTQFAGLAIQRYGTSGATAGAGGNFQFQTDGAELTFSAEL